MSQKLGKWKSYAPLWITFFGEKKTGIPFIGIPVSELCSNRQSLHLASLKVELVSQESIGASDAWLVRLPNSAYIIGELTTPVLPQDMPMTVGFWMVNRVS